MLLVIDVGNTHSVVGLYDGDRLAHHFRLATAHGRTEDEYGVLLDAMLRDAGVESKSVTAAVIASVVPPLNQVFENLCRMRFGLEPLLVGPGIKTGMPIQYESPRDVGADRIVNGIAGYDLFHTQEGGPYGLIIVDFGTATTFDVISPAGEYMGGCIAPGVQISTEALFRNASKLPRVDLVMPQTVLGRSTVHSMQSGILFGYVALVDGLVARLSDELDFEPKIVATGGVASLIADHSSSIERVDPFLTLRGLRIIHLRNSGGHP